MEGVRLPQFILTAHAAGHEIKPGESLAQANMAFR